MDDAGFDAELDGVLIGGRERRDVVIVPYDRAWPDRFERERSLIERALGDSVRAVHHVGSTSVEGLAAKPVIDIALVVGEPEREDSYLPQLERAGYHLRVREPGHRMVRTAARDVHVHIWSDPADTERHLVFRDWLRHSPEDRAAYEALKHELAQTDWDDVNSYARAKGPLIEAIMERVEAGRGETGESTEFRAP
jgi:GrpB-like predicted nucleotidyltransferase (UPF0157 family)